MSTVLVTGACGFTGRYLVAALQQRGYDVVAMTQDLLDLVAVEKAVVSAKPKYVVHLAALSSVDHADQQALYQVNVFGTENLLTALGKLATPPEKVIIASSANVYGMPNLELLSEAVVPMPINHYANSKLAMEHLVRTRFSDFPLLITRPFNYTGPGQTERFLVPKIIGHFRRQQSTIELGNIEVSRDFTDVRDVVAVYVDLLSSGAHSQVLNICSGQCVSLREILNKAAKIAGYEITVAVNPQLVRSNEISRLMGDNTKLKQYIKFAPVYSLEQTLLDMYQL